MPLRIIDYGHEFHISWEYDQWHKRNLAAVKDLHVLDIYRQKQPVAKYIVTEKKKYWKAPAHDEVRKQVEELKYTHHAEIILPAELRPEMTGDVEPLPELSIDLPITAELRPYQRNGIAGMMKFRKCMNGDEQGLGKAQPLFAKIATPDGFVTMGDLKVGQRIFSSDGSIQKVTGIFPQGFRDCYRVTLNDGTVTWCDEEHLWCVRDQNRRRRGHGWTVKKTSDLLESGLFYQTNEKRIAFGGEPILKWEIPLAKPVQFKESKFVIHPYILGTLLGDGSICGKVVAISIPDSQQEILSRIQSLLPSGLKTRANRYPSCPQYYITQNVTTKLNPFRKEIIRLGINVKGKHKFIPKEYLYSSIEQRMELLKGLMDTDGSAKKNRITFHTCSSQLAKDVQELVESLGGQAILREYDRTHHNKSIEWQVNIRIDFCPFHLRAKCDEWKPKKRVFASRYIKAIEKIGRFEQQCISVSSADKLYLTDHYIVTHNTLQSLSAAIGIGEFPGMVIAPAATIYNWQNEWHKFSHKRALVLDPQKLSDSQRKNWFKYIETGEYNVAIVSYQSFASFCVESYPQGKAKNGKKKRWTAKDVVLKPFMEMFKFGIIDESHRCKDPNTNQSKFILRFFVTLQNRFLLSGTPVVNKPKDLWPQLAIMGTLNPVFGGKKAFLDRYCEGGNGANNLKELNYLLNKHCFFRREKKDVAKDLPEKMRQTIVCDITTRAEYTKAEKDMEAWLESVGYDGQQIDKKMQAEALLRLGVLRQISARGKLKEVGEFIEEVMDAGEKLVVFCNLYEIVDALRHEFPHAVTVTGRDSSSQKQSNIERFQKDPECQLIICNIKAAGVGITLTASSRVAFVEYPWTYADCVQCEDRCHRIGQVNNVMCTYFNGKDTVDEKLYGIIQEKRHIGNAITGASDQMEFAVVNKVLDMFSMKKEVVEK